ncbi:hypothetical protein C2845_PM08G08420 [Panicum miliaceum]|uniref:Uncharacterized protein n=1 Tax=Panicum miliaceum TaxID=4540 RepID=A0A3L6R139_PANMI|nr:hypothetical protein C2845_PM08G08420 [Panicum miliaceum]
MQGDAGGNYFFFSAPASPVHYILRSPPSSTAASSQPQFAAPAGADSWAAAGDDFEFAARGATGPGGGPEGTAAVMSSAEELFVAGRIRVGCGGLSPIRQEEAAEGLQEEEWEECDDGGGGAERERDGGRTPRAARRARSASPPRSPRAAGGAAETSDPSASSSSSSSSSAKNIRRRISLRDLLARTGSDCAGADQAPGAEIGRMGFWPAFIWPSRSSRKALLPCPAPAPAPPQPGRRSTSSDRAAAPAPAKRAPGGGSARRTTSLPYRQGLVLGCLGFGARSYGLAKSMHPLSTR